MSNEEWFEWVETVIEQIKVETERTGDYAKNLSLLFDITLEAMQRRFGIGRPMTLKVTREYVAEHLKVGEDQEETEHKTIRIGEDRWRFYEILGRTVKFYGEAGEILKNILVGSHKISRLHVGTSPAHPEIPRPARKPRCFM